MSEELLSHTMQLSTACLLFFHGLLVPQTHHVPVGVGQLRAIAPEGLLRPVAESNPAAFPVGESLVDIVDLEPQRNTVVGDLRLLLQKDRKAFAVLQRHCAPVGHLELDLQAERRGVPVARPVEVADRQAEMIELHHAKRLMKPPPSTRLPAPASSTTQAWPAETPSSGWAKRTMAPFSASSISAGRSGWLERRRTCTGRAPSSLGPSQLRSWSVISLRPSAERGPTTTRLVSGSRRTT